MVDTYDSIPDPASLKRNTLFNAAGSLTYQGCLWLTTVLVVLLSGYYDSGVLAFAMAAANMFTAIATYSVRVYQVSDTDNEYTSGNYVAFRIVTVCAGLVIIMGYVAIVSHNPDILINSFVYMLFKADEAFSDVLYGIDQKYEHLDYVGVSQFIRGVLLVMAFSLGLFLCHNMVVAIAATYIACALVTVLYDVPHSRRFGAIDPSIALRQVWGLLKTCLPIVLGSLFMGCVVAVPRQYYGELFSMESLGVYAAIATPAVLVQAVARYLYSPILVPFSKKWVEESCAAFKRLFLKSFLLLVVCVVIAVVVFSFLGEPFLILVFGDSVRDYVFLFPYVLMGTGMIALIWFLNDTLVVCRDIAGAAISSAVAFVTSLVSMPFLIGSFDMNGINFVIIVATVAGAIAAGYRLFIACRRHEGELSKMKA